MDRTVVVLLFTLSFIHLAASENGKKVVCRYYKGSPQVADLGRFTPEDIPLDLCPLVTYHAMDFPAWRKDRYEFSFEEQKQVEAFVTGIRRRLASAKVIISIDGVSDGGERYSLAADVPKRRKALVKEFVRLATELALDAIEVDWEWPALDGEYVGGPTDRDNLLALLADLKNALRASRPSTEVWFFGSIDPTVVRRAYRIEELCSQVDYVVLFSFGLRTYTTDWKADVESPMRNRSFEQGIRARTNVVEGVQLWLDGGCPPKKLIFTVSPVANSLTLIDAKGHNVGDRIIGFGIQGKYLNKGRHPYHELCSILDNRWNFEFDNVGLMPYAYQDDIWVTFENIVSLRHKIDLVEEQKLAGVAIQFVHFNDFRGVCGPRFLFTNYLHERMKAIVLPEISFAINW